MKIIKSLIYLVAIALNIVCANAKEAYEGKGQPVYQHRTSSSPNKSLSPSNIYIYVDYDRDMNELIIDMNRNGDSLNFSVISEPIGEVVITGYIDNIFPHFYCNIVPGEYFFIGKTNEGVEFSGLITID